jgi:hypothetical protein
VPTDPAFLLPADAMSVEGPDPVLFDRYVNDDDVLSETDADILNRFRVDDDYKAEWAMRKLAAAQAEIDALEAERDRQRAELDAWFDRRTRPSRRTVSFMGDLLTGYGYEQAEEGRKTVDLPSGKIRATDRRHTPRIVIDDPTAVSMWAEETLDFETISEIIPPLPPKVLVSKLGANVTVTETDLGPIVVDANGVPVPGVHVEYGDLTVKVDGR